MAAMGVAASSLIRPSTIYASSVSTLCGCRPQGSHAQSDAMGRGSRFGRRCGSRSNCWPGRIWFPQRAQVARPAATVRAMIGNQATASLQDEDESGVLVEIGGDRYIDSTD